MKQNIAVEVADQIVQNLPEGKNFGAPIKDALHEAILNGGEPTRKIADFLHGTWLGHPLHSVLTDVTIGAWVFGALFDALSIAKRSYRFEKTADDLTALGAISAVPTALAGITDYSAIKKDAAAYGTAHGLLNTTGLVFYLLSLRARKTNRRGLGLVLSVFGLGILTASAWIGGELVYRLRVGVNHSKGGSKPEEWTPVLPLADLIDGHSQRLEFEGESILLYRHNGEIYAIDAVCSHAGGPLDEGKFYGYCVQCPWHDSVYDLRDGSVVHGPSTYAQPSYQVRVFNGQIEVRAASKA